MIVLFISYLIILIFIFYKRNKEPFSLESQVLRKILSYSYFEIAKQCNQLGYEYKIKSYVKEIIMVFIVLGVICQFTINNWLVTIGICSIYSLCLPIIHLQRVYVEAQDSINEGLFTYLQTALMLLRENKTVFDILKLCEECCEYPIKEDLHEINAYISKTGKIAVALTMFEKKYPNSFVKNLNIVMKNKNDEGALSEQLIDYFYMDVENFEVILNEFKRKRKANHTLFYLIECLNAFGVLALRNFVSQQSLNSSSKLVNVFLLFYVLNLVTILLYEQWCNKINYFE